jgi:hypothetical protein
VLFGWTHRKRTSLTGVLCAIRKGDFTDAAVAELLATNGEALCNKLDCVIRQMSGPRSAVLPMLSQLEPPPALKVRCVVKITLCVCNTNLAIRLP